MPHLEYFVVAESFAADQFTNRVSIFNVLAEIVVKEFPVPLTCCAICAWDLEESDMRQDFGVTLKAIGPNGVERDHQLNFTAAVARQHTVFAINGLPVEAEGDIRIDFVAKWRPTGNTSCNC